jgi:hypothetical protein
MHHTLTLLEQGTCNKVAFAFKMSVAMGLLGILLEEDHCGYEVAIEILLHSCWSGSYSDAYTQFDKFRKLKCQRF